MRMHVHELQSVRDAHTRKVTEEDYACLPARIILLRHAESEGNMDQNIYSHQPDHTVSLTATGKEHALQMGVKLHSLLAEKGPVKAFFMSSPYNRTLQTTDRLLQAFRDDEVVGVRQAVQLREQDFGNFQDPTKIKADLNERQLFGRFWFRFPGGESGADVYDRLTIFEDHLTRDMMNGRFSGTTLILVTHGLTLRIFLMRWFHWTVDEFLQVYNPSNCSPVIVERLPWEDVNQLQSKRYAHAKHCFAIEPASRMTLHGCSEEMGSYRTRATRGTARQRWLANRKIMEERGLYGTSQVHMAPFSASSRLAPDASATFSSVEETAV